MGYQIEAGTDRGHPYLQIRDINSDTVRLMWQHPTPAGQPPEDPLARALAAEEALHSLFKRLFLLAAEQRLAAKSAGDDSQQRNASAGQPVPVRRRQRRFQVVRPS